MTDAYVPPDIPPEKLIQALVQRLALKELDLARCEAMFTLLTEDNQALKIWLDEAKERLSEVSISKEGLE